MTSIILKKSSVASKVPTTGDLAFGELAINYQDGVIYYKTASNAIKRFVDSDGINSRYVNVSGDTITGALTVNDSISTPHISGTTAAFTNYVTVADSAYGPSWNGSVQVPTKNAVFDKIESVVPVSITLTAPSSPSEGDLWWPPDIGNMYIYYVDSDATGQWVEASPSGWVLDGTITQPKIANDAVGQNQLESVVSLIVYDSTGVPIKTLYGAGA